MFITNKGDDTYMKNYFRQREVSQDDGFLTSMALGYMTDSTLLGTALGGNMMGAMIGDMLNNNDEPKQEFQGFGGGDFGGGGAGGTWDNEAKSDTTQTTDSLNTESQLGAFS